MKNNQQRMSIFIINLKKDTKKEAHMQKLCCKHNLKPIFIEAIYGKELNEKIISQVYSRTDALKKGGKELSKEEIGCALSHRSIYQKMIDENIENSIILEDDVDFDKGLLECMAAKDKFPQDCELLLLGYFTGIFRNEETNYSIWYKKKLTKNYIIRRPTETSYGTHGYFITIKGAKKLLTYLKKIILPIDHYTGNSKYTNLYIIVKPIVFQNPEFTIMSNIEAGRKKILKNYNTTHQKSLKRIFFDFLKMTKLLIKLRIKFRYFYWNVKPIRKYH